MFDNNPVYWSDPSGADAVQTGRNFSYDGADAQLLYGLLVTAGTVKEAQEQMATLYGFDSFEEFINFFRADKNPESNNDGSTDGNGGPKKSKQIKELQEYYKHQQTIQEWENLGIWDNSVTYNNWFYAVGSYLTLVMPTARFNGLFNFFSREGSDELFNFTKTTLTRMNDPARAIPVQTLDDIIKAPLVVTKDPQGSKALMYYSQITKLNGKIYNVEVLYEKTSNTIFHFLYSQRALGPLPKVK